MAWIVDIPSSISSHLLLLCPAEGQLEVRERAVLHKALQVILVEVILILMAAAEKQPTRGNTLGQLYREWEREIHWGNCTESKVEMGPRLLHKQQ